MNVKQKCGLVAVALSSLVLSSVASATADANVTAATTAAQTAFTDSFPTVASFAVGIVVSITLVKMAIGWFRKAAK